MTLAEKILARASEREAVQLVESPQVMIERGDVRPGMILIGSEFHPTMCGALGAFGTLGPLPAAVPATIRIEVEGEFRPWISAKDLMLRLGAILGAHGANGRVLEFDGPAIRRMTLASRMVLANVAAEAGATAAFTPVDEIVMDFLRTRTTEPVEALAPDPDAVYERVVKLDAGEDLWEPQIAGPDTVECVRPISAVGEIPIDQAVLGSCANGRLEDLRVGAAVVAGGSVNPHTRLIVVPASEQVYRDALRFGYIDTLVAAGAVVHPPGCEQCVAAHTGGKTCLSSANCSCLGDRRSGDPAVYLASPAVVAASAMAGKLVNPGTAV